MPDYLTTVQAAALLGVQPKTVAHYILRGLIAADKHGRDYRISPEELARFQRERRLPGRPKENHGE